MLYRLSFLLLLSCTTSEDDPFGNIPMNDGSNGGPSTPENLPQDSDTDEADTGTTTGEPCEGKTIGTDVGQCAEDFSLTSSTGELVSLYDYQGSVLFLDLSAFT